MRRIRIGNDIILRIRLTRRGGAENLEGKKIGLMLRNILGSVSLPVVQSGEELIAGHTAAVDRRVYGDTYRGLGRQQPQHRG